ncbi:MAG TPA: YciI family protein [Ktedonobacteraceae bacterium]
MRMFVLISRFQRPLDEVNRFLSPHSAWVQRQYESGRFLVSGRREPSIGGIIVARASNEQELREVLTTDPLQQMGLAEYEVFAFEATDFPKRSSAFESFASSLLRELPFMQETEGPHAHE